MNAKKNHDLTGQKFNKLTAIEFLGVDPIYGKKQWKCQCDCGNVKNIKEWGLIHNRSKSCGKCDFFNKLKSLIGKRYGSLTIIKYSHKDEKRHHWWLCKCDCGKELLRRESRMFNKQNISCGCMLNRKREKSSGYKGYKEISGIFFGKIKRGAKYRNMDFDVSIEYIWDLFLKQNRKCALTGIDLKFPPKSKDTDYTASLDRIDSSKGYIEGNVQWIHKNVNIMKNEFDQPYFLEICKKVVAMSR